MRNWLAILAAFVMMTVGIIPAHGEDTALSVMETILSLRKEIPDKGAFDQIAVRAREELGTAVSELNYRWSGGKFQCNVTYGPTLAPLIRLKDVSGRFQAVTGEAEYGYLLYLPEHYDPAREYPAILFLHGIGERGSDPSLITGYGPFQYILEGNNLDMIVIAPQVEEGAHWVEDADEAETDVQMKRLAVFIQQMKQKYSIDSSRLYLTGLSMGGRGAYKLACYLPDAFAAVAVCCGRAGMRDDPDHFFYDLKKMADKPVWLIHGLNDSTVDVQHTLSAMRRLLALNGGGNFQMTLYPAVGHASYDYIYREHDLYHWFSRWQKAE